MPFRDDWAEFIWEVENVREQVHWLDHPFIKVRYTGRHGAPTRGPSPRALRTALELVEEEFKGRRIVSNDLVITVEGLGPRDTVRMLEGPGVGDPRKNPKLAEPDREDG